jgi:hypothetical protein
MRECRARPGPRSDCVAVYAERTNALRPTRQAATVGRLVPKVELFVGYQWLNPGGNVPDNERPAQPLTNCPRCEGVGTNLSYNFTKNLALEANYGVNWNNGNHININRVRWDRSSPMAR